jgi:hypothetical protein
MNWYSQLTQLILSFYREDPKQLQQIQSLQRCRVSRRWRTVRIDCQEQQTADAMIRAGALLREPIAQLRLAQQINILVRGALVVTLPVKSSKLTT